MSGLSTCLKKLFINELKQDKKMFVSEMSEQNISDEGFAVEIECKNEILELRNFFGKNGAVYSNKIGTHPDFVDLKMDDTREQYICSVFLDISASTQLGLKYPLKEVRRIKNAILQSSILIFQAMDGHIHRLQGDAIFAYFGHRLLPKANALIDALNASTLMQYFNETVLKDFFEGEGLDPIHIRVGIDIGDDHQVLWSHYGIDGAVEVTSTSIHTDLAAKLQSKAHRNTIMIGEHVYEYLDLPSQFVEVKSYQKHGEEKKDYYVLLEISS